MEENRFTAGGKKERGELVIRGAREHNLKNLDVAIPLGSLVCLSGPSRSSRNAVAAPRLSPTTSNPKHYDSSSTS